LREPLGAIEKEFNNNLGSIYLSRFTSNFSIINSKIRQDVIIEVLTKFISKVAKKVGLRNE